MCVLLARSTLGRFEMLRLCGALLWRRSSTLKRRGGGRAPTGTRWGRGGVGGGRAAHDGKRSVAVALREERGRERQFNSTVGPMPALGRLPFRRG